MEKDIELFMSITKQSYENATIALTKHRGDLTEAILAYNIYKDRLFDQPKEKKDKNAIPLSPKVVNPDNFEKLQYDDAFRQGLVKMFSTR